MYDACEQEKVNKYCADILQKSAAGSKLEDLLITPKLPALEKGFY